MKKNQKVKKGKVKLPENTPLAGFDEGVSFSHEGITPTKQDAHDANLIREHLKQACQLANELKEKGYNVSLVLRKKETEEGDEENSITPFISEVRVTASSKTEYDL